MLDLLLLATMVVACGGIGLPIAELLPARFVWRPLLAPTLGYAVLAVAVTVSYRWGVPITLLFFASCGLACVILARRAPRIVRAWSQAGAPERRVTKVVAGTWLVATLLMLAPRWVGGDQFAVFQGNHWDTTSYVQSAVVYARKSYADVVGASRTQIQKYPLITSARASLTRRPSVHQLYAVFSRVRPNQAYRLYYPFLVFSFSQFVLVALCLLRTLFPGQSVTGLIAASLVFPLGFWGQYVFDINAWSQIGSVPVLFLMFGLLLDIVARDETELRRALRVAGVLAVTVAGSVFLYPEGFIIYAATLCPLAFALPVSRMVRARRFSIRPLVPLAGMAGGAAAVLYGPQFAFIVEQVTVTKATKVSWWQFFQIFFLGRDGHAGWNTVDLAAGLFGLYFVTPSADAGLVAATLARLAIGLTIAALLTCLAALAIRPLGGDDHARQIRNVLAMWAVAAVFMLAPAILLALDHNYWPAGKAVSYAAPVYMTLLALPIAMRFASRPLRVMRVIVIVFVAFQLACGVARVQAARASDGIHYARPYPSIQKPALKRIPWNFAPLASILGHDTHVAVAPMNVWTQAWLTIFLYSRRIPFALQGNVNSYFGLGDDLGSAPPPPWEPDVVISVEADALVARFRDGRPGLKIEVPGAGARRGQ